jgi:hypothetical protein
LENLLKLFFLSRALLKKFGRVEEEAIELRFLMTPEPYERLRKERRRRLRRIFSDPAETSKPSGLD